MAQNETITVKALVEAHPEKVWTFYTLPEHITQWNFADPSWHCPSASNQLEIGGRYLARMEAKDGSFGFDFEAVYTNIQTHRRLSYVFGNRHAHITFTPSGNHTEVSIQFEAESENPIELQRNGWQAILNQFKHHCESQPQ